MMKSLLFCFIMVLYVSVKGQGTFDYTVDIQEFNITGLPGLHSYAFAQHDGKWLIIGGRKDGLHARQPNSSFPQSFNNTEMYVIDVNAHQFWAASVNSLPTGIKEHLQSTNMSFIQVEDTLFIVGGYAYAPTATDHITFPNLTSVLVSSVIHAIIQGQPLSPHFKQITDQVFAVTGGQLGRIGNTFYLVGGHRFDGRYNPMGHATYTQTYTNQIRKFKLNNSGSQLAYSNYSTITDPIHLRRRDYNLIPQIFPNGNFGYTIASGVFQLTADLPFLYPVDITETAHIPITSFNQYLCHYHCARTSLYDSLNHEMHTLFFGGMSQFYYLNETLIEDIQVPFIRTISRLTRLPNGTLQEYRLPVEMPGYQGASAEFIPNLNLPHLSGEILNLSSMGQDTLLIGHIYGGIYSPSQNPFSVNQTQTTYADSTIFAVRLIRQNVARVLEPDGRNPWEVSVYPNPMKDKLHVHLNGDSWQKVDYFVTNASGQIVFQDQVKRTEEMDDTFIITLGVTIPPQSLVLTFVVDDQYYITSKVLKH